MLFGDLSRFNAARQPDKIAVIDGPTRLTWSEVDGQANRFANALCSLGAHRGDRIVVITGVRHEWLITVLGAAKAGVTVVPIGVQSSAEEILFLTQETCSSILIADENSMPRADEALRGDSTVRHRVVFGPDPAVPSWQGYKDLLAAQSEKEPRTDVSAEDELVVLFSSGTTGRPKGVILTHRQVTSLAITNAIAFGSRNEDVGFVFVPVNHKGAFHQFKLHAAVGASVVLMDGFEVRRFLSNIERERITNTVCFPSMFKDMFALPDFDTYDLSSLRRIMITGTVMTRSIFDEAVARLPHVEFQHAYGLTDAGGLMTVLEGKDQARKTGSVGKAVPFTEVQLQDESGQKLPWGMTGEIVCRSESIMKCYLNQPELTAEALRGGWLHTGDLGKFDEEGYLWVVGRLKDLIKTGGENVAPVEVEEVLTQHPAVLEAAVFGMPDERWGEAVTAVVTLRPGQTITERDLIDFCGVRLAYFKKPKRVRFMDSLPKNPLGAKILKNVLKEQLSASTPG